MIRSLVSVILVAGFVWLLGPQAWADDVINLKATGEDAKVVHLKRTSADDADIVPVFHGALLRCLCGGCCYRPAVVCCAPPPPPVYYGCSGGFGGGYAPLPAIVAYQPPIVAPRAFAYLPPSPVYAYSPRAQTRAVVTLPRLGLSLSLGDIDGRLVGRSSLGNSLLPPSALDDVPPMQQPPISSQRQPYRYDGGPANPVPMPGTRTAPIDPATTTSAANNRVKAPPRQPTWLAYGEQPAPPSADRAKTVLVKNRQR